MENEKRKGFLEIRNKGEKMVTNSFIDKLKEDSNFVETENGGISHKTTLKKVYDMFALGGVYRSRSDEDCILLFKNAFEEDQTLALKCLFYLRDIRGGQGERRFFRVCFNWLAKEYPDIARRNLVNLAEYGRYDDLYCVVHTPVENDMFKLIKDQLKLDYESLKSGEKEGVSLLAKWVKSENASSQETKDLGNRTREYLQMSHKQYRKMLSALRTRINIVEKLMSENRWNEIEFDKIPSRAGLIYRNAFAKRDADRYAEFMKSKETKVNAGALYPYDIVSKVTEKLSHWYYNDDNITEVERKALNKYWANLKDYLNGEKCSMMCVVDTSGSMTGGYGQVAPIDVAISLGMYCAERLSGPFHNNFISFASRPQFIEIEGIDFVDKVKRIYAKNLVDNTDLTAVFSLLKSVALTPGVNREDIPKTIVVISDMEIDHGSYWRTENSRQTKMEAIRAEWAAAGLEMPKLVYWNVCARHNLILDDAANDDVTFVSGCSPVIFESVITGKSGWDLCLDKLMSERYDKVK